MELLTLKISFPAAADDKSADHQVGDKLLACSDFSCDQLTPGAGSKSLNIMMVMEKDCVVDKMVIIWF